MNKNGYLVASSFVPNPINPLEGKLAKVLKVK